MTQADHLDPNDVRFFSGSSNPALAAAIASYLNLPLEPVRTRRFANDNLYVQLGASVRSRTVYIVQSFSPPVNEHVVELLMMLDIARGSGAREVHAILPYFSFARSDKKDAPRISITGKLMAKLLETAGATHVISMTLHSPQVHGFFDVPTDILTARPVLKAFVAGRDLSRTIVVAPDGGRMSAAARFAESLGLPVAAGSKTRISDTEVRVTGLIGEVHDSRRAIIYDDEISSGASAEAMSQVLIERGIEEITIVCTHGVLVGGALDRLTALPQVTGIVTTDTVPIPEHKRVPKLQILTVAPLFGEAIRHNYLRQSIGDLYTYWKDSQTEE
jgi:ribose-phosphate pyrophosphokinase